MSLVSNSLIQKNTFYLILIFSNFIFFSLKAQVTIGSDEPPLNGALLDLKEIGTTKKGLNLPRVILTSLIIPSGETSLSTTISGATGAWEKDNHIGLLVYHVGKYDACDSQSFPQGLYVWDGNKWQYIGQKPPRATEVEEFTDSRDGQVYLYRNFGTAGDWMLENMRYIDASFTAGTGSDDLTGRHYAYPKVNTDPSTPGTIPSSWRLEQGLLYSYSAATLGEQAEETVDQGQGEADEGPSIPIQGICPQGWHIPSDREWNDLEREIYNNAETYSQYTSANGLPFNPTTWDNIWETTDNPRGSDSSEGHGKAMLSTCPPVNSPYGITEGKSLTIEQGGFNALLTGTITDELDFAYGQGAVFYTSSVQEERAWIRYLYRQGSAVVRGTYPRNALFSIRCKRNN
ncbi:hypothetical protein JGH11_16260 [Dysgonomonas sp. Marseille-P4677]|uniref:FISUMP domain-containing protein n=1 Tax=Dysgonomonas sp. Marseille-P4677 TaxID=2364790 RepID=UPI001913C27E|nr:FISUMP domain-containing protein [Dysgonomonas sp. Marseille-P4677]MBK5722431.1 hypothetical protein [Dysgonomonas sp. Marseille-P4677]